MIIIILLFLGLAFGSFVNALVWRLKTKRSIAKGRSICTHCYHTLAWYDLVPVVSWLMLGGKCRYCNRPISAQYPLVELVTAGLFLLSYAYWPREICFDAELAYFGLWLVGLVILVALAVYDLRWLIMPDKLNWSFVFVATLSIAVLGSNDISFVVDHLAGAGLAWGFFALIYYGSKGKWLGGGDVKFSLGMGAWLGWANAVVGILVAFYSASLVILPLLLMKVVKRKQPIPFGPFLIIGTIVAMLFGQNLIDWYRDTFFYASL